MLGSFHFKNHQSHVSIRQQQLLKIVFYSTKWNLVLVFSMYRIPAYAFTSFEMSKKM